MDDNDFIVAIRAILSRAKDEGWTVGRIVDTAHEAVQEFEDESTDEEEEP